MVSKPRRTQTLTSARDGSTSVRLESHLRGPIPTSPRRWFRKPYTGS
jgi:hypothetical protein